MTQQLSLEPRFVIDTKIAAYQKIRDGKVLGERQREAYVAICEHGPITRNELDDICISAGLSAQDARNPPWSRRLVELERMGVIYRRGQRQCRKTGYTCDVWATTGEMPHEPERRTPRPPDETIQVAIFDLRRLQETHRLTFSDEIETVLHWLQTTVKDTAL